jgi:taurine dioxygenase
MTDASFRVEPVAGALGAQIHGVDLSEPMSDEAFEEIRNALHEHLVIFFRDQDLTTDQHYAFAQRFGELMPHPYVQGLSGYPEIIEIVKEPEETRNWGGNWHADLTFMERPPGGAVLYGRELPPFGGDTMFANMYLAYETLSEGMREMLDGLGALHVSGEPQRFSAAFRSMYERRGNDPGEHVHPVVRTHPVTGRRSLFVNCGFTRSFEDMTAEESGPVLGYLYDHATRPEFTFRFRWSPGSVLIWDNRVVLHNALNDDFSAAGNGSGFRRVLHRATLEGERPM